MRAAVAGCLHALGKQPTNTTNDHKGAAWKVAVAAWMKRETDASNGWLAEHLKMGNPTGVSQVVGAVTRQPTSPAAVCLTELSEKLATRFGHSPSGRAQVRHQYCPQASNFHLRAR